MSATTKRYSYGSLVISHSNAKSGVLSFAAPATAHGHARAKDHTSSASPRALLRTPPRSTTLEVNQNMFSKLPVPCILGSNMTASSSSLVSSHPSLIHVHPSTQLHGMQSIAKTSKERKARRAKKAEKNYPYGPRARKNPYLTQASLNLPLSARPSTSEPSSMPHGPLSISTNIDGNASSSDQMSSPSEYSRPPSLSQEFVEWTKAVHWADSTFESETANEWIAGHLEHKTKADHTETKTNEAFNETGSLTRTESINGVKSIRGRWSCRRHTMDGRLEHATASTRPAVESEQDKTNDFQDESNRYSGTTMHTRSVSSNELERQCDKAPPVRRHYLPFETSSTLQNYDTPSKVEDSHDLPKDPGSPKYGGYLGRLFTGSLRGKKEDSPRRRRRATTNAFASYSIGLQRQTSFKLSCLLDKFRKDRKY